MHPWKEGRSSCGSESRKSNHWIPAGGGGCEGGEQHTSFSRHGAPGPRRAGQVGRPQLPGCFCAGAVTLRALSLLLCQSSCASELSPGTGGPAFHGRSGAVAQRTLRIRGREGGTERTHDFFSMCTNRSILPGRGGNCPVTQKHGPYLTTLEQANQSCPLFKVLALSPSTL